LMNCAPPNASGMRRGDGNGGDCTEAQGKAPLRHMREALQATSGWVVSIADEGRQARISCASGMYPPP
jgi:hypothetical protein